ncbi:enoyl-CoA hydratase/isomerase family protein [Ilumatobacter sp.]|uniref:enoyl-CoA hydratase/isomerase family protein n=1 Tax=Ilumatobacter sp. TaxID=1967498 RepID=UPI003B517EFE
MTFETLRYEVEGGLARLTLDRPDRMNAMTNRMVREATDALEAASTDPEIRVLLLTGAGRSFCPGADLGHFTEGGEDETLSAREFRVAALLHEVPAVTVAAINGACAGAGLGWALACDLRTMAASAKCNTAFLDVAVAGDMAIPWSLPRLVGAGRARELSFLPRKVTAQEALDIGLVARVFADDAFADETEAVVDRLLAMSPTALRGMKANYLAAERTGLGDYLDLESERHLRIAASADTAEAFRAFLEKRPPRFT